MFNNIQEGMAKITPLSFCVRQLGLRLHQLQWSGRLLDEDACEVTVGTDGEFGFQFMVERKITCTRKKVSHIPGPNQQVLVLPNIFDKNKLMEVSLDLANKSTRLASATLISGSLYSILVKYMGSKEIDPVFLVLYNVLQWLRQFSCPTNSDPECDHLIYFLMVMVQGLNPEIDGLEDVLLNKMDNAAALITH